MYLSNFLSKKRECGKYSFIKAFNDKITSLPTIKRPKK